MVHHQSRSFRLSFLTRLPEAVASLLWSIAVEWVRRHFRPGGGGDESVIVRIYAPNGDVLSTVEVARSGANEISSSS